MTLDLFARLSCLMSINTQLNLHFCVALAKVDVPIFYDVFFFIGSDTEIGEENNGKFFEAKNNFQFKFVSTNTVNHFQSEFSFMGWT